VVELASWDCEECGKKFREWRYLYLHTRYHHLEPGTCDACNKSFPSRVQLLKHMQRNHKEQPDRAFICTGCGHSFKERSNFRRHVKKVCGVKKVKVPRKKGFAVQCDQCNKNYKHQRTLTDHQLKNHCNGQESAMASSPSCCCGCSTRGRPRCPTPRRRTTGKPRRREGP
jgi:hypothetical protein